MDELITLLIFGSIAAISTWLNKKRQERAEREQQHQPSPLATEEPIPAPRRASNWEEELRRLLEGESPAAPPPRPVPPLERPFVPPVITRVPAPPPVFVPSGQPVFSAPTTEELLQQARERQAEARQALRKVEQQSQTARQHADGRTEAGSISVERVRALVHDPAAMRSAFIVSLVFGPPKSLEEK